MDIPVVTKKMNRYRSLLIPVLGFLFACTVSVSTTKAYYNWFGPTIYYAAQGYVGTSTGDILPSAPTRACATFVTTVLQQVGVFSRSCPTDTLAVAQNLYKWLVNQKKSPAPGGAVFYNTEFIKTVDYAELTARSVNDQEYIGKHSWTKGLAPGDILFFRGPNPRAPGNTFPHVGIYAGGGQIIDTKYQTRKVVKRSVFESMGAGSSEKHFTAIRILEWHENVSSDAWHAVTAVANTTNLSAVEGCDQVVLPDMEAGTCGEEELGVGIEAADQTDVVRTIDEQTAGDSCLTPEQAAGEVATSSDVILNAPPAGKPKICKASVLAVVSPSPSPTVSPKPTVTSPRPTEAPVPCSSGVLVTVEGCVKDTPFNTYLAALLKQFVPVVLFFALVLIVFSGIQYMMGGISGDNTKKAKQRIIGVTTGVAFFLFITLILNLLAPGLSI